MRLKSGREARRHRWRESGHERRSGHKGAKARQSSGSLRKELEKSRYRGVFIGVPDKYDATYAEVDWRTYQNMVWDAINADYTAIAAKADALTKILETGKTVH